MAYKHNLQIMIENEMAQAFNKGHETGYSEGHATGYNKGHATGREESRLSDIQSLMDMMNWSAEQAMDALKIPEEKRKIYRDNLQ